MGNTEQKRESGSYWVKKKNWTKWEVGEYEAETNTWCLIGLGVCVTDDIFASISPIPITPQDAEQFERLRKAFEELLNIYSCWDESKRFGNKMNWRNKAGLLSDGEGEG